MSQEKANIISIVAVILGTLIGLATIYQVHQSQSRFEQQQQSQKEQWQQENRHWQQSYQLEFGRFRVEVQGVKVKSK
jgi:hypothetical protein